MTLMRLMLVMLLMTTSVMATEFRSVKSAGFDAQSMGVGNVVSFGSTALSVLGTPATRVDADSEASIYYADMMNSNVTLVAAGLHKQVVGGLSVGAGVMNETIDAGYRTTSSNSEVTTVGSLSYINSEYVVNASYRNVKDMTFGVSGHYIVRDAFGVQGEGVGVSLGYRYETDNLGLTLGGTNINSPVISYSNAAKETLYATWYAGAKSTLPTFLPVTVYGQYNWVPKASSTYMGGGLQMVLSEYLSVSGGYMQTRGIGSDVTGQVTMGVGLNLEGVTFHYVYTTSDYTAAPHQNRVTMSFKF